MTKEMKMFKKVSMKFVWKFHKIKALQNIKNPSKGFLIDFTKSNADKN